MEHGGEVNVQNEQGLTALHVAVFGGDTDMVNLLLTSGADAALATTDGMNALQAGTDNPARGGGRSD